MNPLIFLTIMFPAIIFPTIVFPTFIFPTIRDPLPFFPTKERLHVGFGSRRRSAASPATPYNSDARAASFGASNRYRIN
jgi:hypothetical protein